MKGVIGYSGLRPRGKAPELGREIGVIATGLKCRM